jgi:osmotically-inducible protein OsmY
MSKYDRPVWGGGAPLFGTGEAGFGTTWGSARQADTPSLAGRGPRGYRPSDTRIYEEVCERLADHPEIDAGDIEVKVTEGNVTLDGTVDERRVKWLAEDCALEVLGLREIDNRLRVRVPVGR